MLQGDEGAAERGSPVRAVELDAVDSHLLESRGGVGEGLLVQQDLPDADRLRSRGRGGKQSWLHLDHVHQPLSRVVLVGEGRERRSPAGHRSAGDDLHTQLRIVGMDHFGQPSDAFLEAGHADDHPPSDQLQGSHQCLRKNGPVAVGVGSLECDAGQVCDHLPSDQL